MWIHEQTNWPKFTWNQDLLLTKLSEIRYRQGLLIGKMDNLGFEYKRQASLATLTSDVVKSSAIEGEKLNTEEVRSSVARRLGIDLGGIKPTGRDVEGAVEMMLDATQNAHNPLSKERLFDWHASLFPTGRTGMHKITVGDWRKSDVDPMQVISGPIGKQKVHFEAPIAKRLESEMNTFISWYEGEQNSDSVLRAAIAHFWFVTIHPFEDGNGRIARAIADMALARADGTDFRYYSLSTQIEAERKQYYLHLERQQRGDLDITYWLEWFLDCLDRAIGNAESLLGKVIFKAQLWEVINDAFSINERQKLVINRMTEDDFEGHMNSSKYAKIAKCSTDSALRDIKELLKHGIFKQNIGGGRSTSYRLQAKITPNWG